MVRNEVFSKKGRFKAGLIVFGTLILGGIGIGHGLIDMEKRLERWDQRRSFPKRTYSLVGMVANNDGNPGTSLNEWARAYDKMGRDFSYLGNNERPTAAEMIGYLQSHKDSVSKEVREEIKALAKEYNSF